MATDNNQVKDDFDAELNADVPPLPEGKTLSVIDGKRTLVDDGSQPAVRERPSDSADKKAWVDYCVDLGADRNFITKKTFHANVYEELEEFPGLTVEELIQYADENGG